MSDQENITTEGKDEDLEAHGRRRPTLMANEGEAQDETKDEDDVQAHGRSRKLL